MTPAAFYAEAIRSAEHTYRSCRSVPRARRADQPPPAHGRTRVDRGRREAHACTVGGS